jgi:hypothetical protein
MDPQKNAPQDLSKEQQETTNGGGILGGDNSALSTSLGINLHTSSTDDDGDTTSNSFGGDVNSDSLLRNDD